MVKEIILHYNGSEKRFRSAQINKKVPNIKIRSLATYRKAMSEFKRDDLGSEWITAMETTTAALFTSVPASKIKGYVQHFEKELSLQISLFTEKQLDCLHRTPYEHRILHIDATGNMVKVPNRMYKRILNYSLLVKNFSLNGQDESCFNLVGIILFYQGLI